MRNVERNSNEKLNFTAALVTSFKRIVLHFAVSMHSATYRRSASWPRQLLCCQYSHYFVFFTWIVVAVTGLPIDGDSGNSSQKMSNYRLPDNVVPTHYDIKLIPHIRKDNFTFDGESSTVVQVRRPTTSLHLHASQLTIDEAATKLVGSNGNGYVPTAYNHNDVTQILAIEFENDLPSGEYTLHLKFVGLLTYNNVFGNNGIYYEGEKTELLIATQFAPISARRAFPCWDEPALKATFKISIKHKRNYTALSNMPIREQTDVGNNTVWTHFETTPIMSTYLVAFIVMSNFVRVPNEDGTINVWCGSSQVPNVQHVQEIAVRSRQLLTEYTNSTLKIPKIDQVMLSLEGAKDMENWGLIFYNYKKLFEQRYQDVTLTKLMRKQVVAYEMAHQWLGNTVSPAWWSQVWVNKGLAKLFSEYIMNQMVNKSREAEFFVTYTQRNTLHKNIENNMKSISVLYKNINHEKIIDAWKSDNDKVLCILRMLHHILSGDVFRKGIIKYLHAHEFGSATADDLWSAMQEALDESDVPHDDYNVKEVMDTWIQVKHYPVVYVTRNYENGDVILTQKPFRSRDNLSHVNDEKWWIPITFATRSNPDFSNTVPTHWLKPQDENLVIKGIDLDDWVIVNVQEMGYYRVQYDFPSWYKIADYLNSDDYGKIHVLNRAQILDDLYHFMIYSNHPSDLVRFKELVTYLHRETDFIAWMPIFVFLSKTIHLNDFQCLNVHLVGLMNELVNHAGFDDDPEDDFAKVARIVTLQQACSFFNMECLKMVQKIREKYLSIKQLPPKYSWMLPENGIGWAGVWLMQSHCDSELDSTILQKRWIERPDIFINLLNTSVSDDTLPDGEYNTVYDTIVQKHTDNDSVLEYLLENIDKTTSRGCTTEQILEKIINNVHSTERLEKIRNFVKDNLDNEIFERIKTILDKRGAEL